MRRMILVMCVVTLSCASPRVSLKHGADAEAEIRAADQAGAKAIASKSLEQTLSFYDPEAITAGNAIGRVKGLAALRELWIQQFAQLEFSMPPWKLEEVAVTDSGTIGYSSGAWPTRKGKTYSYLTVWRKQANGRWKVLIDGVWY